MRDHQKFQSPDHLSESPFTISSRGTTPERPSFLSEAASSCLSPGPSDDHYLTFSTRNCFPLPPPSTSKDSYYNRQSYKLSPTRSSTCDSEHLKMRGHQKFQSPDHLSESPFTSSSRGTTPERPSSFSEPTSSCLSPASSDEHSLTFSTNEEDSLVIAKKKFDQRKTRNYVYRIREHVKMGPKFSETVKGKLSVGAKILRKGGRENIFRHIFGVSDGEQLLKASQCYLSTTAGPIAGMLFISTQKVAFCSERRITFPSPSGLLVRAPYKVVIPVKKIKRVNESENVEKPAQKYIEIVTEDNFEFWFMGFVRYERAFLNLQKAISMYK